MNNLFKFIPVTFQTPISSKRTDLLHGCLVNEFKKDNPLANIHKYDYVSMLKDFDSIFGENEVVNEVVNDNVLNTEVNPNVATNDAGGSYDALYGDYETDDDGVMRAMPNSGGGGTPYSEDDDFAIDRWW